MPKVSVNEIVAWTGKTRATVMRKIQDLPFEDGPKQAKLYDSGAAMEAIYGRGVETGVEGEGTFISNSEAQRLLTIARKKEIEQNMEVTSKERIPLEDVEEINNGAFENICGALKANVGKELSDDLLADMLAQLRGVGAALLEVANA